MHNSFYASGQPDAQDPTRPGEPGHSAPPTAGGVGAPPLGLHCEISGQKPPDETRRERYRLQSIARSWLDGQRTPSGKAWRLRACLRHLTQLATGASVLRHVDTGRAKYGNLQRCGSVWVCPACAAQITEHRRREVGAIMDLHYQAGGACIMVTLTHSHRSSHDLRRLLEGEREAHARMSSWRAFKDLVARIGRIGTIRAREATWGAAHGWHPHTHDVWLLAQPLQPAEIEAVRLELYDLWHKACAAVGLPAPNQRYGVSVDVAWSPAEYLAKWGTDSKWGTPRELTKGHSKRGREDRWTPFDVLRDTPMPRDQARLLWREYAAATFGARQLTWSRGLKAQLHLADVSDEAIVEGGDEAHQMVTLIAAADWRRVLAAEARARVLEAAEAGGATGVTAVVAALPPVLDELPLPPQTRPQPTAATHALCGLPAPVSAPQSRQSAAPGLHLRTASRCWSPHAPEPPRCPPATASQTP